MRELTIVETKNVGGGNPIVAIVVYLVVRSVIQTVVRAAVITATAGATTAVIENTRA